MEKRSRNFDGCWTCRSRKVKCDLQKPKCNRCKKARLSCGGYGIKLGWVSPFTVSKNNSLVQINNGESDKDLGTFQRRNIEFVHFPKSQAFHTFAQLTVCLDTLENKISKDYQVGYKIGPFLAYRLYYNPKKRRINEVYGKKIEDYAIAEFSEDNDFIHEDLLDCAKLTIRAIKGVKYKLNEQNILHILYPKFFPNIDSDDWTPDRLMLETLFQSNSQGHSIKLNKLFRELVLESRSFPFSFIHLNLEYNFWQEFVHPYLNHVFFDFACINFTDGEDLSPFDNATTNLSDLVSHIKMVLAYLTLGLSSFKKSREVQPELATEEKDMDKYLILSINLRKASIIALNKHLDEYDNNMTDETFEYDNMLLLCIILQVQLDSCYSVFENFELLFAIGDFMLKNRFTNITEVLDLSRYLVTTFQIIYTFFASTHSVNSFNYSIDEADFVHYRDLDENYNLITDDEDEVEDSSSDDGKSGHKDNNASSLYKASLTSRKLLVSQLEALSTLEGISCQNLAHVSSSVASETASETTGNGELQQAEPFTPSLKCPLKFQREFVYAMFGLPLSLLQLFFRTIHLSNHKRMFQAERLFPRNFPKMCADIEDAILNWNLSDHWCLFEHDRPILPLHEALFHNVMSFHSALLVYFYRIIKASSFSNLQKYVKESLSHFYALQEVNRKQSRPCFTPSFWMLLICGSELKATSSQESIVELWNTLGASHTNNWRAKQILYEVWKRNDAGESTGWLEMVREWDVVLCLI